MANVDRRTILGKKLLKRLDSLLSTEKIEFSAYYLNRVVPKFRNRYGINLPTTEESLRELVQFIIDNLLTTEDRDEFASLCRIGICLAKVFCRNWNRYAYRRFETQLEEAIEKLPKLGTCAGYPWIWDEFKEEIQSPLSDSLRCRPFTFLRFREGRVVLSRLRKRRRPSRVVRICETDGEKTGDEGTWSGNTRDNA